ncbi:MAG: autotransporter outer membrane beta-barrel domain-containing protein [Halioglobus sp.]|nr:autotransporter outer membrane beta-barrel domain-containing protein [Halioglobus sp.]
MSAHGAGSTGRNRHLLAALVCALAHTPSATAGLNDLQGQFSNDVEESSALANQATYDALLVNNGGNCLAAQRAPTAQCGGAEFELFTGTRSLVQTANEIAGEGPIEFSLGLDLSGLGEALRWRAGEEFAGQGSLTTEFVNGQLSGLASRVSALRFGATGFALQGFDISTGELAQQPGAPHLRHALGASGDDENYGGWSGFLNGSYGYGDKDATGNENAFDFEGYEVSAGLDYRLNDQWVVGGVLGYVEREVDFQQIDSFVVDGGVETDGYSIAPFVLYQAGDYFATASVGYQEVSFETNRFIKYPSLNPDVFGTNSRSVSDTDSATLSVFVSGGYTFYFGGFIVEPFVSVNYLDITVDAFSEQDLFGESTDLRVEEQEFESLEGSLGAKFIYAFSTEWGVITPYVDVEWRLQFEDDSRIIEASYNEVAGIADDASVKFQVETDELDDEYFTISLGAAMAFAQGWQGFVSYRTIEDQENYSHEVISAGVRYEF